MRHKLALLATLAFAATLATPAQADPYRWCAEYGGGRGGGTNCYFVTLEQCRAAVSGNGGFCRQNFQLDDRAWGPGDAPVRRKKSRS